MVSVIRTQYNDLKWVNKTWTAPDGKHVPFEEVDMSDEFIDALDLDYNEAPDLKISIIRWPRKVVVTLVVTEFAADGYTLDGDGDGLVSTPIHGTKYALHTTDRETLERNFATIMNEVNSQIIEIWRRY